MLDRIVRDRSIGIAIANPGVGKSYLLKAWRRRNPRARYVWIEADVVLSPRPIINALLDALGIAAAQTRGNLWDKTQAVAEVLAAQAQTSPLTVILDEADLLTVRAFDLLRSIWDRVSEQLDTDGESAFPLALFGTPQLRVKILRPELERLHRRVAEMVVLDPMNERELEMALNAKWPGVRCEPEAVSALLSLSRGSFGWLNRIVPMAQALAAKDGKVVTARIVEASKEYLVGLE